MTKIGEKLHQFTRLLKRDRQLILLVIIPVAWYIIFCYIPMYGIVISFKDFSPTRGIMGSKWIGFENFTKFFKSFYLWRIVRNTLLINVYSLLFGFPIPIIFALLLNEVSAMKYRKIVQTITYFPHFLSTVIVVGIMYMLLSADSGVLNVSRYFPSGSVSVLNNSKYFRALYVGSGIWQNFGFESILYIAAITGINIQMYEAAQIDGASKLAQVWYITLPSIMPTIMITLLLRLGRLFSQGAEKVLLMYSPSTYEVADIISTYVYRVGLGEMNYSYGTAVGLLNTLANFIMLLFFNFLARKFSETSLF